MKQVGNLRQCSIFIDQYRVLEKSQKNEIYAFLIYQSALDASLRHNNRELEQKIRYCLTHKLIFFFNLLLLLSHSRSP